MIEEQSLGSAVGAVIPLTLNDIGELVKVPDTWIVLGATTEQVPVKSTKELHVGEETVKLSAKVNCNEEGKRVESEGSKVTRSTVASSSIAGVKS